MIREQLDLKLRARPEPDVLQERKILVFQEIVYVFPTFKQNEYNRKPDEDVTFRRLTSQLKMQIREELNDYKKNEMEVHESSTGNTCYH